MDIQITAINIRYVDGIASSVHVHFQGKESEQVISLNGYVPLTTEEYSGNESLPLLTELIKTKLVTRLQVPEETTTTTV